MKLRPLTKIRDQDDIGGLVDDLLNGFHRESSWHKSVYPEGVPRAICLTQVVRDAEGVS